MFCFVEIGCDISNAEQSPKKKQVRFFKWKGTEKRIREEPKCSKVSGNINEKLLIGDGHVGSKGDPDDEGNSDVIYIGNGHALVTDAVQSTITLLDKAGNPSVIYHFEEIIEPTSIALTKHGEIAAISRKTKSVVIISRDGDVVTSFSHENFHRPSGIAVTKHGDYVVTDTISKTISMFDCDGEFLHELNSAGQLMCPRYVTVSPDGRIIVSDSETHCLKVFNDRGEYITSIGEFGSADGQLNCPYGVATDSVGNIIVADHKNNRVSVFKPCGLFLCHLMTSHQGLVYPQGVALSPDLIIYVTYGFSTDLRIVAFRIRTKPPEQPPKCCSG